MQGSCNSWHEDMAMPSPYNLWGDKRQGVQMTFTPKIPPRGPDPLFAIPTTVLEPVLFLVYWGERKRERRLQRTASHQDLQSHMNQLGQVIRADEPVASQVQLHRNMHPGMQLLTHPSLRSAAKPSSNTPPATLHSYGWFGT